MCLLCYTAKTHTVSFLTKHIVFQLKIQRLSSTCVDFFHDWEITDLLSISFNTKKVKLINLDKHTSYLFIPSSKRCKMKTASYSQLAFISCLTNFRHFIPGPDPWPATIILLTKTSKKMFCWRRTATMKSSISPWLSLVMATPLESCLVPVQRRWFNYYYLTWLILVSQMLSFRLKKL